MGDPAESVVIDGDVLEALRKLSARSGQPIDALVNAALRDYIRYENEIVSSVERGISDVDAGRWSTSDEMREILDRAREALTSEGGFSREESVTRARSAIENARGRKT
jgi:predicted transcriptional regulator